MPGSSRNRVRLRRPKATPPARKDPTVAAALIVAATSLAGGVLLFGQAIIVGQQTSESAAKDCLAVVADYDEYVSADPGRVIVLTYPGADGKSLIATDPNAIRCGIDDTALRELANP